jgi:predicted ATPase
MRLHTIRIENFKCFDQTETLTLDRRMNVLVGKNSSGKSTFLEAIRPARGHPHMSEGRKLRTSSAVDELSRVELSLVLSGQEIKDYLLTQDNFVVFHPDTAQDSATNVLSSVTTAHEITSEVMERVINESGGVGHNAKSIPMFAYHSKNWSQYYASSFGSDRKVHRFVFKGGPSQATQGSADYAFSLFDHMLSRVYRFFPLRTVAAESLFNDSPILRPDASNLPSTLGTMDPGTRRDYNELVKRIIPIIEQVWVQPLSGNQRIRLFHSGIPQDRSDLSIPLDQCGSGIAQVLAILYVVLTAKLPQTICIDEPNSFLHPEVARKLIKVFNEFKLHQFIISTHSPEVISAASTGKSFLFQLVEGASKVIESDANGVEQSRRALAEVGAKLSDVFGYDQVLWVEGATEEASWPTFLDMKEFDDNSTTILGVADTNSFAAKRTSEVWSIYEKLSHSNSIIPPAVAFIFDRDWRSESEIGELSHRSGGLIRFLPRRMFENYLLHPAAIAATINHHAEIESVTAEAVSSWIGKHGGDAKYFKNRGAIPPVGDPQWRDIVDGAKLLNGLFSGVTGDAPLEYRKTVHARYLVERIVELEPSAFDEIKAIVGELFRRHQKDGDGEGG